MTARSRGLRVALAAGALFAGKAAAQGAETIEDVFSNSILPTLGYPELNVTVGPSGVVAPANVDSGFYLVTLAAETAEHVAYLNIVQPPAGLDPETEKQLMLDAGRNDIVQHDWVYAGGTNTPNLGESASFVIELKPGDYKLAASYYVPNADEEFLELVPLTVAESASEVEQTEPEAAIVVEETDDLRYLVTPGPVPAGPQIWKITNTGAHHAHHMVMMGVPEEVTAEVIIETFAGMFAGTPTPPPDWMTNATGFGYAARIRAQQGAIVARLLPRVRDIRRIGSAALDLCAVASGARDAFYETGLHPWDRSAGLLIAAEAGARTGVFPEAEADRDLTIAAAPAVFDALHTAVTE